MNIQQSLHKKLLEQMNQPQAEHQTILEEYQFMAFMYAKIENGIAVLSDMQSDKSYIYLGKMALSLGLSKATEATEINSIWEEDIFHKIHPEDLLEKHLLELKYFNLLRSKPHEERSNYHVKSKLRMLNKDGIYQFVIHRMFYIDRTASAAPRLALCLYNFIYEESEPVSALGMILNSATGEILQPEQEKYTHLLSMREKEILSLIRKGVLSKEIADILCISINTVNRHRQNILQKLRVHNSLEACRIAERMHLI